MIDVIHSEVGNSESTTLERSRYVRIPDTQRFNEISTWYSDGDSLPSRAFLARALVSAEIVARPLEPTSFTIGVMRPEGVATATEMSVFLYLYNVR